MLPGEQKEDERAGDRGIAVKPERLREAEPCRQERSENQGGHHSGIARQGGDAGGRALSQCSAGRCRPYWGRLQNMLFHASKRS